MALVGNIRDFGLSDFLYLVDRGYKTGCLHLNRESEAAILFFDTGKLVYATRKAQSEGLGDLLVHLGKLTSTQLQETQRDSNGMALEQVLIATKVMSRDELQKI